MPDREAAIARLLRIADRERAWMEEIGLPDASSIGAFLREVAEMFREQEPVKPELRMSKHGFRQWIVCGNCYGKMRGLYDYCPWCGRKVKWDD